MITHWIGIDPGASGAIAILSDWAAPKVIKLSNTERDVARFLEEGSTGPCRSPICLLESVHAMPKQGVSSTFKFGQSYGFLRGLLIALGISFETVTPGKWQRVMGCLSKGDKNVTKAKAQEIFPDLKITHSTADALLIAEYARRSYR